MTHERGWLIGPGDTVLTVDASGHVTFEGADLDPAKLLDATPREGDSKGRAILRPVQHPAFALGADATVHTPSGDVCRQFYAKQVDDAGCGFYEFWAFGQWPFGAVIAAVLYDEQGADHGRAWFAAGLTWVKQP